MSRGGTDVGALRLVAEPAHVSGPGERVGARPRQHHRTVRDSNTGAWIVGLIAVALVVAGWLTNKSSGLTPGYGAGYWLGIAGALALLGVLIYPMRKHVRALQGFWTVSGWFTTHMLLGTFGPVIVLYHSGFKLGALNSNVALIAMLLVAASGVIGRFLYVKIHLGLHGRRAELAGMMHEAAEMQLVLGGDLPQNSPTWARLLELEALAREPVHGLFPALWRSFSMSSKAALVRRKTSRQVRAFIRSQAQHNRLTRRQYQDWQRLSRDHLEAYFTAVTRASSLILWERLFALWHLAHVPLFAVMVFSAIIHVVAVHYY